MKILQINAVYGSGSTGVIVKDIENAITECGGKAFVAYQRAPFKPVNGYCIGNALDWKMHAFYSRVFGKQAYFSRCATKKLLKWIDEIRPDVIHLHNLHSNYINLPMLLKYVAKKNIATVITLHDCWFFTGKCFHFVESSCDKWQDGCNNCPRKKADVKSWFFDASKAVFEDRKRLFSAINNLTVVGCSDWISSLAKQSGVFKGRKVVTVKNGVDLNLFCPTENKFRAKYGLQDKFIVLGMANKWLQKDNAETVNDLLKFLPDDCAVVLVGAGSDSDRATFNGRVINIAGVTDKAELADIYSSADAFVNLTLADTLPTVNMESIASGTPVITYNSGGSGELVKEGETGFIVDQFDYKKIISAIESIKADKGFKDRCRAFAEENFDKRKKYKEYVDLYQKILEK